MADPRRTGLADFIIHQVFFHYWKNISLILLFLLAVSFLSTYPIILVKKMIDTATGQLPGGTRVIITLGLEYLLFYFILSLMQGLLNYYLQKFQAVLGCEIRNQVFNHLVWLPFAYFDKVNSGDLLVRLTEDCNVTIDGLISPPVFLVKSVVTFLFGLYFILRIDWRSAVIIIPAGIAMSFFTHKTGPFLQRIVAVNKERLGRLWFSFTEGIRGMRDIQANFQQQKFLNKVAELNEQVKGTAIREAAFSGTVNTMYSAFYMSVIVVVLTYAAWRVAAGSLTIGALTTLMLYNGFLSGPLIEFNSFLQKCQRMLVSCQRIGDVLHEPVSDLDGKPVLSKSVRGSIRFQNVTFAYQQENPVIDQLDLEIRAGSKVAIVGRSGAGKSTIVKLIAGLYLPLQGRIEVAGLEMNRANIPNIRGSMAIVFQDAFLVDGTLESNIRFGNPAAGEGELKRVLQTAELESMLTKLPQGLATRVGENGAKLSVGERQRIGLARALLRNPVILILDEITSALDNITAAKILNNLKQYSNCTVIFIAHRLNNITDADSIYVLSGGHFAEQGTFRQLMKQDGIFRAMYNAQYENGEVCDVSVKNEQS